MTVSHCMTVTHGITTSLCITPCDSSLVAAVVVRSLCPAVVLEVVQDIHSTRPTAGSDFIYLQPHKDPLKAFSTHVLYMVYSAQGTFGSTSPTASSDFIHLQPAEDPLKAGQATNNKMCIRCLSRVMGSNPHLRLSCVRICSASIHTLVGKKMEKEDWERTCVP